MADSGIGDFFISDVDDHGYDDDDDMIPAPAVVRSVPAPAPSSPAGTPVLQAQPVPQQPSVPAQQQPVQVQVQQTPPAEIPVAPPRPQASPRPASREERLVEVLNQLMLDSPDIQAAALVSMDGFTIASALPKGMQEDRVGAMSAAILGLGERAAAELGRGQLTQVFIEGAEGYVVLVAAGDRGVLTVLAPRDAKPGLVLYDMKAAADVITGILG